MSSGASAAYEKPALGPVELHRRDAEVEQDPVGADAVAGELPSSTCENSPCSSRALAAVERRSRSKYGRDGRVAVDRDQLALAAQPSDEQLGVPAGAERAVDDRLARPRVERGEHLVGENGDVISLGWQDARQHLPRSLRHVRCSRQAARSQISRWSNTPAIVTSRLIPNSSSSLAGITMRPALSSSATGAPV